MQKSLDVHNKQIQSLIKTDKQNSNFFFWKETKEVGEKKTWPIYFGGLS